jgi:hypothetical protein
MGSSSKKIVKNLRVVHQHALAALLITALFVALRLYRNASTASWWLYATLLPTSATYGGTLVLLRAQANTGSDLFQPGLVDYCWDGMWITMFCQLLASYTDWAWALYSIVRAPVASALPLRNSEGRARAAARGALTRRVPPACALPARPSCPARPPRVATDPPQQLGDPLRLDPDLLPVDQQTRRRRDRGRRRARKEAGQSRAADAPPEGQVKRWDTGTKERSS